ncbi:MAG: ROK family protein [Candidatus Micrarchaeia archaeon]
MFGVAPAQPPAHRNVKQRRTKSANTNINRYIAAVDAGGTNLKIRVVKISGGKIIGKADVSVPSAKNLGEFYNNMVNGIKDAAGKLGIGLDGISEVRVAIPGPGDGTNYVITNVAPGVRTNIVEELKKRGIKGKIVGLNDADAAALGAVLNPRVQRHIIKQGNANIVVFTLGTGIGIAHINAHVEGSGKIQYQLLRGLTGAGEFHYPVIPVGGGLCGCGQRGCAETTPASARGQVEAAKRIVSEVNNSLGGIKPGMSDAMMTRRVASLANRDILAARILYEVAAERVNAINEGRTFTTQDFNRIIAERVRSLVSAVNSTLGKMLQNGIQIQAHEIDALAQKGDPLARMIMEEGGRIMGRVARDEVNRTESTIVVMCGGGANTPKNGPYRKTFEEVFNAKPGIMKGIRDALRTRTGSGKVPVVWIKQTKKQNLGLDGAVSIPLETDIDNDMKERTQEAIAAMRRNTE